MGGRYCAINSPLGPRWGQKSLDLRSRDFCPHLEPRGELIAQYRPPMSFHYNIPSGYIIRSSIFWCCICMLLWSLVNWVKIPSRDITIRFHQSHVARSGFHMIISLWNLTNRYIYIYISGQCYSHMSRWRLKALTTRLFVYNFTTSSWRSTNVTTLICA